MPLSQRFRTLPTPKQRPLDRRLADRSLVWAALVEHVTDVRRAVEGADGTTREVAGLASEIADNVQFQDITRGPSRGPASAQAPRTTADC